MPVYLLTGYQLDHIQETLRDARSLLDAVHCYESETFELVGETIEYIDSLESCNITPEVEIDDISKFLASITATELSLPMQPLSEIVALLKTLGYVEDQESGFETNGWQCDFFMPLINESTNSKLIITGSLYYGNFKLGKGAF